MLTGCQFLKNLACSLATGRRVYIRKHYYNSSRPRMDVGYFDPNEPVGNAQGNLPHWRQEGVTYFVSFRLGDSLPAKVMDLWRPERVDWLQRHPTPHTADQLRDYHQRFVDRFHQWLDAGQGSCILADPNLRQIVANSLTHFE